MLGTTRGTPVRTDRGPGPTDESNSVIWTPGR